MRSVAFYGKGGSGKTSIAASLCRVLAQDSQRVILFGCDPKGDTSYALVPRRQATSVIEALRQHGAADPDPETFIMHGALGVDCVEAGGPEPGVGCAGRGITLMMDLLHRQGVLSGRYDWAVFDVLGDVVCGGFAAPIRVGAAREVCAVLSGEVLSIYAANNICRALLRYQGTGVRLAGLVPNLRGVPQEERILERFAARIGARLFSPVPRDPAVHHAHVRGQTVVDLFPESPAAKAIANLAVDLSDEPVGTIPTPLTNAELDDFLRSQLTEPVAEDPGDAPR